MLARLFLLIAAFLFYGPQDASAERRVALVVGNGAYQYAAVLKNAPRDAAEVAATLRMLDFETVVETDLDKVGIENALKRFARLAADADVALFYYSGHAVQFDEQNYLLPVSSNVGKAVDLPLESIALQDVADVMRLASAKVHLIFLDACRDNPFGPRLSETTRSIRSASSVSRGLARVTTVMGSLVAFSTSPGSVALDGAEGGLSPFTASFVKRALEPKTEIRQVLTRIRADVMKATGGRQVPWDNSSLFDDFYLSAARPPPVFDRIALATAVRGAASPLSLTAPRQPEGGEVAVTIDALPRAGRLALAERTIGVGDWLSSAEFAALAYRSDAAEANADAFSFRVGDAWGNQETGYVTITLVAATPGPAIEKPLEAVALGRVESAGVSIIGLGRNLRIEKAQSSTGAAGETWLRLASKIGDGELILGERKIDAGETLQVKDVAKLSFVPAAGSAGREIEAAFAAEAPASGETILRIRIEMHDCDRLAGARLDLQGVSEGVPPGAIDVAKARPACEAAAKEHPDVGRFHFQLARVRLAEARNAESLASYERALALGHIRSHVGLGYMYAVGLGVPRDYARARAEYQKAADKNDAFGVNSLGKLYYDGRGVERDFERARVLFEQSARVGHTYAMNNLARMLFYGEGMEKDHVRARRYWEEAAARDDMYGVQNLGFAYQDGIAGEKDLAKALAQFKKASESGHPEAPNNVGRMFLFGLGVKKDAAEAARWYQIGAKRGDGWASFNYAEMRRLGGEVAVDLVEAATFYARAAGFHAVEPAKAAAAALKKLQQASKVEALRRLCAKLDPRPLESKMEKAALERAGEILKNRGAAVSGKTIEETLTAIARAEWDASNVRADLF